MTQSIDLFDFTRLTGIGPQAIASGNYQAAAQSQLDYFNTALSNYNSTDPYIRASLMNQDPAVAANLRAGRQAILAFMAGNLQVVGPENQATWFGQAAQSGSGVSPGVLQMFGVVPSLPHPDAGNQELGPNRGGSDGVQDTLATPPAAPVKSGMGGLLIVGALGVGLLVLLRRRK